MGVSTDQRDLLDRHQTLAREYAELSGPRSLLSTALVMGPLFALGLSVLLGAVGCGTRRGPLFGIEADPICATRCEQCTGPYTMDWSNRRNGKEWDSRHVVLCQTPADPAADWSREQRFMAKREGHEQVLPGGNWTLWGLTYLLLLPLTTALLYVRAWQVQRSGQPQIEAKRAELETLRRQLDSAPELAKLSLRPSLMFFAVVSAAPILLVLVNLVLR